MTTQPARFVVFGEALTDFIREDAEHWRAIAGGSCWNVARVGARLGVPTGFAGAVSRDLFGEEIVRLSGEAGLLPGFTQVLDKSPFLAMVVSKHPPTYFFVGDDSADLNFDPARLPTGWLEAAEIVHFGSISLVREPLAGRLVELAGEVKAAGKRIAFDPNYRNLMGPGYRATLERMVRLANYIKVSDEDLVNLFPGSTPAEALAVLRGWAPSAWFLFTRGAQGISLITPEGEFSRPVFRVTVADTVGAGDASMGGWVASLVSDHQASPQHHVDFAAASAAIACTRSGAYAATRAEVDALLAASA